MQNNIIRCRGAKRKWQWGSLGRVEPYSRWTPKDGQHGCNEQEPNQIESGGKVFFNNEIEHFHC